MQRLIPAFDPIRHTVSEMRVDPPQWSGPVIGIDECANNRTVAKLTGDLIRRGSASLAFPVWMQRHVNADGQPVDYVGSTNFSTRQLFGMKKPVKGHSFSDQQVTWLLLGHFFYSDTVVFITENRRADILGIRRLLEKHIEPALRTEPFASLSLTTLARRHQTSWSSYAKLALEYLEREHFKAGYHYVEL